MTNSIKKKIQSIFKGIGYFFAILFYGRVKGIIESTKHPLIKIEEKIFDQSYFYKIYKMSECRLYTDTVNDAAFIIKNEIVKGPSYQFRSKNLKNVRNTDVKENIVFKKGTARLKKKIKGSVFSLLTGGAGNSNYWHWLFDVLPRLKIVEGKVDYGNIDYFLFPDFKENFQIETINLLNIPNSKIISSKIFRHIEASNVIAVDHPYVIKNNPTLEIQNIPNWILEFLRNKFLKKDTTKKFPEKFYIDRKDSKSNHSYLRRILNEDEIKVFLKSKGYEIITLGELSFIDQVNLFKNAKKIIGLHGAGFANLTFCNPQTFVLELKSETAAPVIGNLAKKIGLNFKDISIKQKENLNSDQQGLIHVPLNELENRLINT